jgi:hypothetical protein
MQLSLISGALGVVIITAVLFLSGILGFTPKDYKHCVVPQVAVTRVVVHTFGSIQLKEPVWSERCEYGERIVPGATYQTGGEPQVQQ